MKHAALILSLLLASCGGTATAPNTPAPVKQSLDLTFARSLLDAQASIESAKKLAVTQPQLKDPLNKAIAAYNSTEDLYLIYHQSIAAGGTPDPAVLQSNVANVANLVAQLIALVKK